MNYKFQLSIILAVTFIAGSSSADHATVSVQRSRAIHIPGERPGAIGVYLRWQHGHLVRHLWDVPKTQPFATIYDRDGEVSVEPRMWVDNAAELHVTDVAINKLGSVFASSGAMSETVQITNFIARFSSNGRVTAMVRTAPFVPLRICSSDDNTVWAFGWERNRQGNYPLFRHYDLTKGEIGAGVDKNTVKARPLGAPKDIYFECTGDSVVAYDAGRGEIIRYATASSNIDRIDVPPMGEGVFLTGFAMSESGKMFASMHRQGSSVDAPFVLVRRGSAGQWRQLFIDDNAEKDENFGWLFGVDGDQLVHGSMLTGLIQWTRVTTPIIPIFEDSPGKR